MTARAAAPRRRAMLLDPFTTGALLAGLVVGLPASVAVGIIAGEVVRAFLIPFSAVLVTSLLIVRVSGGRQLFRLMVTPPPIRRDEAGRFAAGAFVAVVGIALIALGGVR